MELISPDGSTTIIANPSRVDYLLSKGWTIAGQDKPAKIKEEPVTEVEESQDDQEAEEDEEEES